MPEPSDRRRELLVLCRTGNGFAQLQSELDNHGMRADLVHDVDEMRSTFFASGGHDLLVVSSEVPPPIAERAVRMLLSLDPTLQVVAFGNELRHARFPNTVTRLTALHPASRAGVVAMERIVRGIS